MALVTITNPSIANSETSDVTKLTANDNDLVNGVTDGTKDIKVLSVITDTISEKTGGSGVTVDSVKLKDTGVDISAAGTLSGQISFPAVQNASSGANILDDYEENNTAPTDGSGASLVFAAGTGARMTKAGRQITVTGVVVYPATADASNSLITVDIPNNFATTSFPVVAVGYTDYATTKINMACVNGNKGLYVYDAAGGTRLTNANLSGKTIFFIVVYHDV